MRDGHGGTDGDGGPEGSGGGNTAPSGAGSSRLRYGLLDGTIVLVLLVGGIAFAQAWLDKAAHDDEASRVVEWMTEIGVDGVAWPAEYRSAIDVLLGDGRIVVLVDQKDLAPQQVALNGAGVVVTDDAAHPDVAAALDELTEERIAVGDLTARSIRRAEAWDVPIEPRQRLGQEFARPYVYAPIQNSAKIAPESPLEVPVTLAPGSYVFEAEAFDPGRVERRIVARLVQAPADVHAADALDLVELPEIVEGAPTSDRVVFRQRFQLGPVVEEPQREEFLLDQDAPRAYVLQIAQASEEEANLPVRLHAWRLRRING